MKYWSIVIGALALQGAIATTAVAQEIKLKIAAGSPSKGNVCTGYLDVWAEKVKTESGGKLDYQMFCDNILVKFGDAVTRVEAGVADIAWGLPGAYGARFAGLNIVGVPGNYKDPAIAAGALWRAYEDGLLGKVEGVKVLWLQPVNNNTYWLKKAPVNHNGLNGLTIGMGSKIRAAVVKAAGGVPVQLRVPEYYQSIAKGAAGGVMTTGGAVAAYSIEEITDYYMEGPFGGGMTFTVMNLDVYNGLSDDLKAVIDSNSGYKTSIWAAKYLRDYEKGVMKRFLSREGTARYELTEEEIAHWKPAFEAGANVWVDGFENGAEVLAKFREYLAEEKKTQMAN